jgi:hypothetical protein
LEHGRDAEIRAPADDFFDRLRLGHVVREDEWARLTDDLQASHGDDACNERR